MPSPEAGSRTGPGSGEARSFSGSGSGGGQERNAHRHATPANRAAGSRGPAVAGVQRIDPGDSPRPLGDSQGANGRRLSHITLLDTRPPVWRRIQVKDGTLDKLHEHIQTAMGWTNSHLHHFRIGQQLYGDPLLMQENFEEMGHEVRTCVAR
jgi:hypothetical protein